MRIRAVLLTAGVIAALLCPPPTAVAQRPLDEWPKVKPADQWQVPGQIQTPGEIQVPGDIQGVRVQKQPCEQRVTFAADGSQLLPGRELSLPVAAVQVAWFENPHTREGD